MQKSDVLADAACDSEQEIISPRFQGGGEPTVGWAQAFTGACTCGVKISFVHEFATKKGPGVDPFRTLRPLSPCCPTHGSTQNNRSIGFRISTFTGHGMQRM